jgi:sarcosine oxidase gamma subunit
MVPVRLPRSTVHDRQATKASAQVYDSESNAQFVNTAVDVESVSQEGSVALVWLSPHPWSLISSLGDEAKRAATKRGLTLLGLWCRKKSVSVGPVCWSLLLNRRP